jgi:hypothetical protein
LPARPVAAACAVIRSKLTSIVRWRVSLGSAGSVHAKARATTAWITPEVANRIAREQDMAGHRHQVDVHRQTSSGSRRE